MDIKTLKNKKITIFTIVKIVGLLIVAVIVLPFLFNLLGASFDPIINNRLGKLSPSSTSSYDGYNGGGDYDESMAYESGNIALKQSVGAMTSPSPIPPTNDNPTGDTAEDFEVTEYNATIETGNLKEDCEQFNQLKKREDVIFENQFSHDRGCNYTFKVLNENANAILAIIKDFKPKDFSENTYTIKRIVDNLSNESEIIKNKKESIEKTLEDAINAYEEISKIATKNQDTESLAKIITSKVDLIERLSREKININAQLDRLARNQADQLDRLKYTRFYVNLIEDKIIDGKSIKESWKNAIKESFRDLNQIVQELSVHLVVLALTIVQYCLYIFILVYVGKYIWRGIKVIWKK